jgi:hypothetical protein
MLIFLKIQISFFNLLISLDLCYKYTTKLRIIMIFNHIWSSVWHMLRYIFEIRAHSFYNLKYQMILDRWKSMIIYIYIYIHIFMMIVLYIYYFFDLFLIFLTILLLLFKLVYLDLFWFSSSLLIKDINLIYLNKKNCYKS